MKINDKSIEKPATGSECFRSESKAEKLCSTTRSAIEDFFSSHRSLLHFASEADVIAVVAFGAEIFSNPSGLSRSDLVARFLALTAIGCCAKKAKEHQSFLKREVSQ